MCCQVEKKSFLGVVIWFVVPATVDNSRKRYDYQEVEGFSLDKELLRSLKINIASTFEIKIHSK